MANMFNKGFKGVKEEADRQEKNRENMSKGLWRFFITEGEAEISFLTEDPINFYEHTLKTSRNGKEAYDSKPCTGSDCQYCDNGDKPSFKSAWLVVDHREYKYKDKDGKNQTGKDQVRLFVYGTKVAGQLDRKSERYGLVGKLYLMERIGKSTSTTYTFENVMDKKSGSMITLKYTSKEIEQLLPEALRKEYDGTMESLYEIIKNQIIMLTDGGDTSKDDDKDDETNERVRDKLVNVDDEEEVKPKVKRKLFKKENSIKKKRSIKEILNSKKYEAVDDGDMPF